MSEKLRAEWGVAPWQRPTHSFADGQALRDGSRSTPDVAIIGGGLTGVSTAYHLAKMGIGSILFESAVIGDGASGRTGGLVLEGTASGILEGASACVPGLKRLVDDEGIDCDLSLPGCWEIVHREVRAGRVLPWSDDGQPVAVARTVSGGIVQPAALVIGIAQAAVRLGTIVAEHSAVKRIGIAHELTIELESAEIKPKYIVVGTNAWINSTLPGTLRLQSSLTFACVTKPLSSRELATLGMGEGIPFYTCDLPYLWGRTIKDGRMIFGAGLVHGRATDLERTDVNEGRPAATINQLQRRVRSLNPVLRGVRFESAWAGPIAFTDDSIPLLGSHPSNPRVLVAGGYAGHGVAMSVHAGELLALSIGESRPLPEWGSLSR